MISKQIELSKHENIYRVHDHVLLSKRYKETHLWFIFLISSIVMPGRHAIVTMCGCPKMTAKHHENGGCHREKILPKSGLHSLCFRRSFPFFSFLFSCWSVIWWGFVGNKGSCIQSESWSFSNDLHQLMDRWFSKLKSSPQAPSSCYWAITEIQGQMGHIVYDWENKRG